MGVPGLRVSLLEKRKEMSREEILDGQKQDPECNEVFRALGGDKVNSGRHE